MREPKPILKNSFNAPADRSPPARKRSLDRRRFLVNSTFAATASGAVGLTPAGYWSESSASESTSANEQLRLLCVGTANRAAANIGALKSEQFVAFCDVDKNYLDRTLGNFPRAKGYRDYREMIDREAAGADGIVVSTADHHHAVATLRAINAGLHVYCEKPLSHTLGEARAVTAAAKAKGVVTQLGTQIHAGNNYRRVVEIIASGAIGDVREVHVWVGKGWGGGNRPAPGQSPPKHLDWDLWLGPAPERPYAAGRYHPAQWRRWWDFGQGTLGDMGCHYMDLPFWALGLRYPESCQAEGPKVHPETAPLGMTVRYQFPTSNQSVPVELTWYDGDRTPRFVAGQRVKGSGVMFVGSAGKLFANYSSYRLFPSAEFVDFKPPAATIPNSIGHHAEWIKACKSGGVTTCGFDYSGPLTETVLLGNLAYRIGKPLRWDAANLEAVDCPEAAALVHKAYRAGWELG